MKLHFGNSSPIDFLGCRLRRAALFACTLSALAGTALAQSPGFKPPPGAEPGQIERYLQTPAAPKIPGKGPDLNGDFRVPPGEAGELSLMLGSVVVPGSTVYSDEDLAPLWKDRLGRKVALAEVFRIADAITAKYRHDGYILSRAILPPQTIEDGAVEIRIVEGYIDEVRIEGEVRGDRALLNAYAARIMRSRPLSMNAAGSISFNGAVNGGGRALTVANADDVTVNGSMNVASFEQLAGTGTTDFGSNTLRADTFVNVSARDIYGRIVAKDAVLKADNFIGATVEVGSLTIEAMDADMDGTVGGLGGQGAADKTLIDNRGPGSYRLNGYTILGTGPGTRTHAELTALPLSGTLKSGRRPATAADAVFSPFTPVFRASAVDAIDNPYAINVFETPFPLLTPPPGPDSTLIRKP